MLWHLLRVSLYSLLLCVFFVPLLALAQASQPTSAPAVASFASWWSTWGLLVIIPTITVLIASIITVLRKKYPDDPKAKEAVGILEFILEVISIIPRRGTGQAMKLPFTRSRHMVAAAAAKKAKPPVTPVVGVLVLIFAFTCSSCCVLKPGTCKTAYGNCAAEVARNEFPDAMNLVEAALSGSTPEIVVKSLDLLAGLGKGLILCCVKSVRDKYAPATQPASGPAMKAASPKALKIVENADVYLKLRGKAQ